MKIIPNVDVHTHKGESKDEAGVTTKTGHVVYPAGEVADLSAEIAKDLLDRGFARRPNDPVPVPEGA